jgi:DNA-binding PadR family transcriptional regulator
MRPEVLKGHLDMLLLTALAAAPGHGYAIAEKLRGRSRGAFSLPDGTIYPALHRLERDKLVASKWSDSTGRRRRVYSLTAKGHRALEQRRQEWRDFAGAVSAVIGG